MNQRLSRPSATFSPPCGEGRERGDQKRFMAPIHVRILEVFHSHVPAETANIEHRMTARTLARFGVRCWTFDVFTRFKGVNARIFISRNSRLRPRMPGLVSRARTTRLTIPMRDEKVVDALPGRALLPFPGAQLTAMSETRSFFSFRAMPMARGSSMGLPSTRNE